MGVDLALSRFFDACAQGAALKGPMLALGSLDLRGTPEELDAYSDAHGYARLKRERNVAALMADRYAVEPYVSCDVNGLADVWLDLAQPLPAEHRARYRSILNGGTLEHVFDLKQAMENIHDATAVGGVMIHTCPTTWFDHGFVNHNPVLFRLTAEANGYELVAEGFYYSPGSFPGQTAAVVSLPAVDTVVPGTDRSNAALFSGPALPANAMYLIALRKTVDGRFRTPVQISQ